MKVSRYFLVVVVATSLFSCKKDNANKDCSLSEANLVGTYTIGSIKYKASASAPEQDASSMVDACSLDNSETFKADHSLVYVDGGVKCNPSDEGTSPWALSGNMLTAGAGGTDVGTISAFDCSGFTLTQTDFIQPGDSFIVTFKKQ